MGIKEKYAYRRLLKKVSVIKRNLTLPDLENVKKIGVIWQPEQIKAFYYLQEIFSRKQVIFRNLCVFSQDNEPENLATTITAKDLNWLGFPKPEKTDEFIHFEFDILFNIALEQSLILDYLTAISQARFKIGSSLNKNNFFDLNINIGENQNTLYLAKQQIFYLGQLNKKRSK